MAEAQGGRAGVARACKNLGNCMSSTGEYMKAIYFKTQCPIAGELELKGMRSNAALDMGVAMRLHIREDRQAASANPALSLAAGDNRACSRSLFVGIGASGRSSARGGDVASDCRHCWLASARLHLTPLVFDAGFEDLCIRPSQGPSLLACGTGTCHVCWLPAKTGRARYRPSDAHVQRRSPAALCSRGRKYVCMYVCYWRVYKAVHTGEGKMEDVCSGNAQAGVRSPCNGAVHLVV